MQDDFGGDAILYGSNNGRPNKLAFLVAPLYDRNKSLKNEFFQYCKVQQFLKTPANSERRKQTMDDFRKRAGESYRQKIEPEFKRLFDECEVVSDQTPITGDLGSLKGAARYKEALNKHFSNVYPYGKLVTGSEFSKNSDELRHALTKPVDANEYTGLKATLNPCEDAVERYLLKQYPEVPVQEIVKKFAGAPYGWNEYATLYVVNELVRRHKRAYILSGDKNADIKSIAAALTSTERNKVVISAAQAIDQSLIDNFMTSWKNIFGVAATTSADGSEQFRSTKEKLLEEITKYRELTTKISRYPFAKPVLDLLATLEKWQAERDMEIYFKLVIDDAATTRDNVDLSREIIQFCEDHLSRYLDILKYADDNKDNFNFLQAQQKEAAQKLLLLKDETNPNANMPSYKKMKDETEAALNQLRVSLQDDIRSNYDKAFEELIEMAQGNNVNPNILPDKESIIAEKSASTSLYALKTNASTDEFYKNMVKVIMEEKQRIDTSTSPVEEEIGEKTVEAPAQRKVAQISLATKTMKPLTNETEVDEYLAKLKRQLMSHLDKDEDVMIVK